MLQSLVLKFLICGVNGVGPKRDQHVRINRKNTFLFVIVGRYRDIFGFNLGSIWVIDFLGAQVRPVLLSVFCLEIDHFFLNVRFDVWLVSWKKH